MPLPLRSLTFGTLTLISLMPSEYVAQAENRYAPPPS
ncbi:hypothetical protein ACZ87_03953, partial [Candidatus Erwinia dacicola]